MENEDFEQLLLNWASWARDKQIIPVSCRSLESHYKSPPVWYYPELRVEIDLNAALMVERTLTNETFPKAHMAVIVYASVYPWRDINGAIRKINKFEPKQAVKPANFDQFLKDSKRILFNRLKYCALEKAVLYSEHNLITAEKRACHMGELSPAEM